MLMRKPVMRSLRVNRRNQVEISNLLALAMAIRSGAAVEDSSEFAVYIQSRRGSYVPAAESPQKLQYIWLRRKSRPGGISLRGASAFISPVPCQCGAQEGKRRSCRCTAPDVVFDRIAQVEIAGAEPVKQACFHPDEEETCRAHTVGYMVRIRIKHEN